MVQQISSENTKKVLLEGNETVSPRAPKRVKRHSSNADVIVENATEKRYLWTARAFAIIFAVSMFCNLILTYVIITIMPLYRIEPYLFTFSDKKDQIYKIEPVQKIYEQKYLTEIFIREYILTRNSYTNDVEEMERRWGNNSLIREMSSDGVYNSFRKNVADKLIEYIRKYNIVRDIRISSVTEVGGANANHTGDTWWEVEFKVEDMSPEKETPEISVWVARLKIRYRAKRVKFSERLKNPLGFTVIDYKQVERKKN